MIKQYSGAKNQISRFVTKQSFKSSTLWALVIGMYVASKSIGYGKLYNTQAARDKFATTFANNAGINALLGRPHDPSSITGYTAWNTVGVVTIVLSIWALLLATKTFRGNEDYGRTEILLTGQTTAKRAAINMLKGLSFSLILLYIIMSLCFIVVGSNKYVDFSSGNALFLALTCLSSAAIFISVGALTSQLMPTRSKAAGLASGIFGVFFLIRATADLTSLNWLLNVTPLGWIEKTDPLTSNNWQWFIPIVLFVILISALAVYFAGKRDLGDSIIKEKYSAKPKLRMLSSLLPASIKLNYLNALSWMVVICFIAAFYGLLTKSATQLLKQSASTSKYFDKLSKAHNLNIGYAYLSVAFLIYIIVLMAYAANSASRMRQEEADGYLDNLLTRPVKRLSWINDRTLITIVVIILSSILAALITYLAANSQHAQVSLNALFKGGLNSIAPAIFTFGISIFVLGFMPRLTSVVAYFIIGWSFLISMVSSGIKLNHWILDTSVLYHINLAPAVSPNWHSNYIIMLTGVVLFILGSWRFNYRDLANE